MRWRSLRLVGWIVLLAGCGASGIPTAERPTPLPPAYVAPEAPVPTPVWTSLAHESDQVAVVRDLLQQSRARIEEQYYAQLASPKPASPNPSFCFQPPFALLTPTEVAGYAIHLRPISNLAHHGASVTMRLINENNPEQWIEFAQTKG